MKLTKLFALLFVLALALFAGKPQSQPSEITVMCVGGTSGTIAVTCPAGETGFIGTGYPHWVEVVVTYSNGNTFDDNIYDIGEGFTENLTAVDTYTITVNDRKGNFLTSATVTTE